MNPYPALWINSALTYFYRGELNEAEYLVDFVNVFIYCIPFYHGRL